MTNYLDDIADQISVITDPHDPVLSDRYRPLYRNSAVVALTTGVHTTAENVHDAWSAWCLTDRPDHYSIKPFNELPQRTQDLDLVYVVAIREVARQFAPDQVSQVVADATRKGWKS